MRLEACSVRPFSGSSWARYVSTTDSCSPHAASPLHCNTGSHPTPQRVETDVGVVEGGEFYTAMVDSSPSKSYLCLCNHYNLAICPPPRWCLYTYIPHRVRVAAKNVLYPYHVPVPSVSLFQQYLILFRQYFGSQFRLWIQLRTPVVFPELEWPPHPITATLPTITSISSTTSHT